MGYKMKGTTLYGKPTGKGGFTKGDLTVSRTGNDNMADGRSKSSAFQKITTWEKIKAAGKGLKKGISTALDMSSHHGAIHSTKMGYDYGKRARKKALKEYDKD
jgi:hypothetical protein